MTVFAILMPTPQPEVEAAILDLFANDNLEVAERQWLVSSNLTVVDLSARSGIVDKRQPEPKT